MWAWNRFVPVAIVSIAYSLLSLSPAIALEPQEIAAQAAKFVVKIDGGGGGTGFIVRKNGNSYTVLTNEHVIRSTVSYTVTTSDNRVHTINSSQIRKFSGVDLAEIEFSSTNNYSIAKLNNSSTNSLGEKIYTYGFNAISQELPERSQQFFQGSIAGNSPNNRNGYSLTFNLTPLPGLSGSPLLDESGKVIGIYGKADRQKGVVTVTLGIPISTYQKLIGSGRIETVPSIVSDQNSIRRAEEYFETAKKKQLGGNNRGALVDYNSAIALKSDYARAYVNRGLVKAELNDNNGALADYNRAISLKSDYLHIAYLNRAALKKNKLNDNNGALADYNQAIALKPDYADAYNNRGDLKTDKLNDNNGALADFNQAIALNSSVAYNNRAALKYNKLDDINGALADFNQAIVLDPKDAYSYYGRAIVKYELKDINGSKQDFRQAERLYQQQKNDYWYQKTVEELRNFD